MRGSLAEKMLKVPDAVPLGMTPVSSPVVSAPVHDDLCGSKIITTRKTLTLTQRSLADPDSAPEGVVPSELGVDSEIAVFSTAEKRDGCGRYPFRVRTL
jgi:hypothetical protein